MSKVKDYSELVHDRLEDIVPQLTLSELEGDEVAIGVKIAFNIIGYTPKNLEKSLEKSWEFFPENSSKSQGNFSQNSSTKNPENSDYSLFEFIYRVWRCDNGLC